MEHCWKPFKKLGILKKDWVLSNSVFDFQFLSTLKVLSQSLMIKSTLDTNCWHKRFTNPEIRKMHSKEKKCKSNSFIQQQKSFVSNTYILTK